MQNNQRNPSWYFTIKRQEAHISEGGVGRQLPELDLWWGNLCIWTSRQGFQPPARSHQRFSNLNLSLSSFYVSRVVIQKNSRWPEPVLLKPCCAVISKKTHSFQFENIMTFQPMWMVLFLTLLWSSRRDIGFGTWVMEQRTWTLSTAYISGTDSFRNCRSILFSSSSILKGFLSMI